MFILGLLLWLSVAADGIGTLSDEPDQPSLCLPCQYSDVTTCPRSVFTFPGLEQCYSQLSHSPFFHSCLLSWAYFSPHLSLARAGTPLCRSVASGHLWARQAAPGHPVPRLQPGLVTLSCCTPFVLDLHFTVILGSLFTFVLSESPTFCFPCLPPWIIPSYGWDTFSSSFPRKGYERSLWDTVLKRLYLPQAIDPWLVCTKKTKQQQNSIFHANPLIVFWAFASTTW